jgi:hypothetical protein
MRDPFRSVICNSIEGLYGALKHKPRALSGGEQAEGNAATAEAAGGLLEDRTWAMMPQRGSRSPTAEGVLGDAGWSGWGVDVGQGLEIGADEPGRTRRRPKAGAARVSWWTTRWLLLATDTKAISETEMVAPQA